MFSRMKKIDFAGSKIIRVLEKSFSSTNLIFATAQMIGSNSPKIADKAEMTDQELMKVREERGDSTPCASPGGVYAEREDPGGSLEWWIWAVTAKRAKRR